MRVPEKIIRPAAQARPGCRSHFSPGLPRLLSVFAFILIATWTAVITRAQSQTSDKPAATSGSTPVTADPKPAATPARITGTIKGRVVAADGQPLTDASVMAQALSGKPVAKPTRVDAEGRFAFEDLPAASYLLIGMARGYIDQSLSPGDASQWPRHLIGSNVRVTMIKGGVITGVVTNAKGEPLVGVPVQARLQSTTLTAVSFFNRGGGAETDDRGVYRMYGLLPGQYAVYAGGSGQFGRFNPSGFDVDAPTYYPSSTRDTAVLVSVRSGDETSGIDIRYKGLEGHAISGVVLGKLEENSMGGAVSISLSHAGSGAVLSLEIAPLGDQRHAFSFNGVADGEYDLFANFMANLNTDAVVGTKRVTVRGADVTGVELNMNQLGSITGSITLDPLKPEDTCDKRGSQIVEIIPTARRDEPRKSPSMITILAGGLGRMDEQGGFALRNLEAAKYRLEIKLPTESWYLRAITLPGAPARITQLPGPPSVQSSAGNQTPWQGVVTVKSGEKVTGVSVFVGQNAAGLRGRVETEGAIREGSRVHLVPVERDHTHNVLRYYETLVKSDGSFALANIAPGSYFVMMRVEPPTAPDASPQPIAWDLFTRLRLRREAEAANTVVELKPCQRVVDYSLKPARAQ